jgi:hypothetical protein
LSASDTITTLVTRSLNDSVAIADSAAKSVAANIGDSVDIDDGATALPGYAVSLSETITIGDVAERPFETEPMAIGDVISTNGSVIISESLAVGDVISTHVTRSLDDAVELTDAASVSPSVAICRGHSRAPDACFGRSH